MYRVTFLNKPKLKDPILVMGLPGVGNVAKLAVAYLAYQLEPKPFVDIYSTSFSPEVYMRKGGRVEMPAVRLFTYRGRRDFIIGSSSALTQPENPQAQYELSSRILTIARNHGVRRLYTVAGNITPDYRPKPKVWVVATSQELVCEMEGYGLLKIAGTSDEDRSMGRMHYVSGMNGLLLGLGVLMGMEGVCLLSDTSYIYTNPRAALAALDTLQKIFRIQVDVSELEAQALSIEKSIRESEKKMAPEEEPYEIMEPGSSGHEQGPPDNFYR